MKEGTLCFVLEAGPPARILLGYKKGGFGEGKWDGFGGKIEEGETVAAAAARELVEESAILAMPEDLEYVAHLEFLFPSRPEWSQVVHTFFARQWKGSPTESDEMVPQWFSVESIPYARMWDDSMHWLPLLLAGKRLRAQFTFQENNQTVGEVHMRHLEAESAICLAAGHSGGAGNYPTERDTLWKLRAIASGLNLRLPEGDEAFRIATRLLEECGELAQQVNHFQGVGIKREKMGEPSAAMLAKEIKDVLLCALQLAQHYGVEQELRASIESSYQQLKGEECISTTSATE